MNEHARRLLPPMAALHSFMAAARHESFSKAAEEIGLTQSAVSRQVAALEDWLQIALFDRNGRRVQLNADGRAYADAIGPALAAIRVATARALAEPAETALRIATLPTFGMRWLAPRLGQLTRDMPDLVIEFAARSHEFDFAEHHFDAAIHYGLPTWPGAEHDLLFRERAIPVIAPRLLDEHRVAAPRDLLHFPLLAQAERRDAWRAWLHHMDVPTDRMIAGPTFEHFLMLAQAAVAGAGVALLPSFMIGPELESGDLVCPFDQAVMGESAYYLVYPAGRLNNARFARLREWILAEAAQQR
ncbi:MULTISPECIES: transcriptional regulator GcvA [unclassified Sphingopyxis]|uniref:transcriptional regulator GcvA n=1 Tax=unclassified Sphingopyxis TaxID=2614943 RepID=UPI000736C262|nr:MULTISPECIES: transcriptional regulator GcvA [unclassified Sphingopyxis]KTE38417.1 LysR family transcriptional regulator [Sphingopyxis sp. HIX]KTE84201.1 LysR family transcriptional regulator [Sphingopyxis sp. HXXIV]